MLIATLFLVGVLVALYLFGLSRRAKLDPSDVVFDFVSLTDNPKPTFRLLFVLIPGILSRGTDLADWLVRILRLGTPSGYRSDALVCTYVGEKFDFQRVAKRIAEQVAGSGVGYDKVVFIGPSMGGMLTGLVVEKLRNKFQFSRHKLGAIVFDSPSGWRDLKGGGDFASQVFRASPFSRGSNRWPGKFLMAKMTVPPKVENIGDRANFSVITDDASINSWQKYCDWVIARARKGLAGHLLTVWIDQLAEMARVKIPWSAFRGVSMVYLAYSDIDEVAARRQFGAQLRLFTESTGSNAVDFPKNDTVKQPQAAIGWVQRIPVLTVWIVRCTHCGWGERPDANRGAIVEAIKVVLR